MSRKLIILLLLPLLFACGNNSKPQTEADVPIIHLTYDEKGVVNAAGFVDSVQVVLLEGGEEALIGSISRLDVLDNLFVVTDLNTKSVFVPLAGADL